MMYNIKSSLVLIFCLFTFGIIAQNTGLSGNISTFQEDALSNVTVTIKAGDFMETTTTNEEGNFSFENITSTEDLIFEFEYDNNPLNGVSTFDYVLAARHILGITPFDAANQYIAMDINGSGNITAFDLIQLRQLILNVVSEFPNNRAWRFVEKSAFEELNFSQENDPEYDNISAPSINLTVGQNTVVDIIGIKIGDANGNADTN